MTLDAGTRTGDSNPEWTGTLGWVVLVAHGRRTEMPRYVVERTFPDGLNLPAGEEGNEIRSKIVRNNAELGVTWLHSYVSGDRTKTFCVYDAPNPEAVEAAGRKSGVPVDNITQVSELTPYEY